MTWNYRIIDVKEKHPYYKEDVEHFYGIYEVYYDKYGKISSWVENGTNLEFIEDIKGVSFTLDKMQLALQKPILKLVINEKGNEELVEEKPKTKKRKK